MEVQEESLHHKSQPPLCAFCFLKPNWIMTCVKRNGIRMFNLGLSPFMVYNRKEMIIGTVKRESI